MGSHIVGGGWSVDMFHLSGVLLFLLLASVSAQDYGPVNLDSVDALTLSWNQIHWLVKDQIQEVEALKSEHNEIYNEITRCFGNENCLNEFELLDTSPGSKLFQLGLRAIDLSGSAMTRMREEVLQTKARLDAEMRERWTMDRKIEADRISLAAQEAELRRQEALAEAQRIASSSSSSSSFQSSSSRGSSLSGGSLPSSTGGRSGGSSSSSSSWSTSSSSYTRGSSGGLAQGQSFFGLTPSNTGSSFFSSVNTTYGTTPEVFERRYQYTRQEQRTGHRTG